LGLVVVLAVLVGGCGGGSTETFKIGVIGLCSDLPGNLAFQQDRSDAGAELPFLRRGAKLRGAKPSNGVTSISVGGRHVKLLLGCAGIGDFASDLDQVRRLVEQQHADAVVLPFSTDVGLVFEPYVRRHPGVTFLATAIEQTTTLKHRPPNLFRFELDGAQQAAGLGTYAYRTLGWRDVVTVGADVPFDWTQVAGFVAEFCSLGGNVVQRLWTPWGETNYAPVVRRIRAPRVDGVFFTGSAFGGTQSRSAFGGTQSRSAFGGTQSQSLVDAWAARQSAPARHLLLGTLALFLGPTPDWLGVVGGSAIPYARLPSWTRYVADLKRLTGEDSFVLDTTYYNASEALLEALEQVRGDTSSGERPLQRALARLRLESPRGLITLDARHQAIGETYLGQLERNGFAGPFIRQIRVVPNVEATFNGYFSETTPPPGRTQPTCRHGNPPAWAR
jgi:branched-chain amino acid transport system substrate-binding protein